MRVPPHVHSSYHPVSPYLLFLLCSFCVLPHSSHYSDLGQSHELSPGSPDQRLYYQVTRLLVLVECITLCKIFWKLLWQAITVNHLHASKAPPSLPKYFTKLIWIQRVKMLKMSLLFGNYSTKSIIKIRHHNHYLVSENVITHQFRVSTTLHHQVYLV